MTNLAFLLVLNLSLFACINPLQAQSPGELDLSFGNNGKVVIIDTNNIIIKDMAIQPDGKIVLVGTYYTSLAVWRFNNDGTLDNTFNSTGFSSVPNGYKLHSSPDSLSFRKFTFDFLGTGIAIQPNGKIVVVGQAQILFTGSSAGTPLPSLSGQGAIIACFNANGTLDSDFKGDCEHFDLTYNFYGTCSHPAPQFYTLLPGAVTFFPQNVVEDPELFINSVDVKDDGKIVFAGYSHHENIGTYAYMHQVNSNGKHDSLYLSTGAGYFFPSSGFGTSMYYDVLVAPDQSVYCAGTNSTLGGILVKFNSDGHIDTTFKSYNVLNLPVAVPNVSPQFSNGTSIIPLNDGNILVGGYVNSGGKWAIVRIKPNGQLDNLFGVNGLASFSGSYLSNIHLALQTDGKIIAVGLIPPDNINNYSYDHLLIRWNNNGTLDSSFGTNGIITTDVISNHDDFNQSIAIQPDGKIVVSGTINIPGESSSGLSLVRYHPGIMSGIDPNSHINQPWVLYPNPSNLSVTLSLSGNKQQVPLTVTNFMGMVVMKHILEGESLQIDISSLPQGMYFLNGKKFMKQ